MIPPGHPSAGAPFVLPAFLVDFLRDAMEHRESLLCIARKNAKSCGVAIYALARLAGPLAVPGWRGGCLSISKPKAAELKMQMEQIAEASGLEGLRFMASPVPGHVLGKHGGRFDILAEGHASGLDDAIIDELGLLEERDRENVNSMRTSISARDGRFIALTIHGHGPFVGEMLARRDAPAVSVHHYYAPADCKLDDESAWRAANPGLGTIKSLAYMRDEAARVALVATDEASFRALDLNAPYEPGTEMICSPDDLRACFVDELPPRSGPAYLGLDAGEATSATSCCAIFPATGRLETWTAFGDKPSLRERGRRDNAAYVRMSERGELWTYPGRVVPVPRFLSDVKDELAGVRIAGAAADGWKDSEVKDWLDRSGAAWPITFRRVGAGKDGGADTRRFQRHVILRDLKLLPNLSLVDAISKSVIHRDQNGNPGLDKRQSNGRIDVLSAAIIAAGLASPHFHKKAKPRFRYMST